jgi:hypothetical protein
LSDVGESGHDIVKARSEGVPMQSLKTDDDRSVFSDIVVLLVQVTSPIYPGFKLFVPGHGSNLNTSEYKAIRDTKLIPEIERQLQALDIH